MCYLKEDATLQEILDFLGMQYSKVSITEGNEYRDVYEFIKDGTMAVEVFLEESKVRFHSELGTYMESKDDKFWDILFEAHLGVLARLLDGLEEKYSGLGTLTFEFFTYGQLEAFDVDYGPCGWQLRWKDIGKGKKMQRQHITMNGYGNNGTITLYLADLERRVRSFNNKAREVGLDLRIRLTNESEEYAYYADLILPNKNKIPFKIRPNYDWGMYGKMDFPKKTWTGTTGLGSCGDLMNKPISFYSSLPCRLLVFFSRLC